MSIKRKTGIIAFTDILGYSSFMENNDVGEQLEKVLTLLGTLPNSIKPDIKKWFEGENASAITDDLHAMIDSIQYLVVSDSILTMMEFHEYEDETVRGLQWCMFNWYMSKLQKEFLDYGLPLRGAISFGEYITVENSFAGKPIIEAYKCGNTVNSIGIKLDDIAEQHLFASIKHDSSFFNGMSGLWPLNYRDKKNNIQKGYFVSPIFTYGEEEKKKYEDKEELIIYLTKSFSAHSKTMNKGGEIKLKNSIELYHQSLGKEE